MLRAVAFVHPPPDTAPARRSIDGLTGLGHRGALHQPIPLHSLKQRLDPTHSTSALGVVIVERHLESIA